jgi:hypothetical protein
MTRSSQEGLATRAFMSRGENAARNIAANSAGPIVEENYLLVSELVDNVYRKCAPSGTSPCST